MNSVTRWLSPTISYALYFALFVLVAGFFAFPESSKYHTIVYLGFYIPALVAVLYNARSLGRDLLHDRALQAFTLLLVWFGITLLWSPFEHTNRLLKLLLMLWVLVLAVRLILDNMRLFNLALSLALAVGTVVLLVTIFDHVPKLGLEFYNHRLWYIGERYMSAVTVGQICTIFFIYCISQALLSKQPRWRIAYVFMGLVYLVVVVFSFSRTAFMALSLTVLWYFLQQKNMRLAVVLAALSALLFMLMLLDADSQWLTNISRSETFEIRIWGWKATWELIQESWLLGYGIRAPYTMSLADTPFANTELPLWHPHNFFLSIWYESGLVGLGLTMMLLYQINRKVRPLMHNRQLCYWCCIFVFVATICLVDSPALIDRPAEPWIWFWLILAIAISAEKIASENVPPEISPQATDQEVST